MSIGWFAAAATVSLSKTELFKPPNLLPSSLPQRTVAIC